MDQQIQYDFCQNIKGQKKIITQRIAIDTIKNKRKEYYKQTGKAKADVDYQKNKKQKNSLACLLEG